MAKTLTKQSRKSLVAGLVAAAVLLAAGSTGVAAAAGNYNQNHHRANHMQMVHRKHKVQHHKAYRHVQPYSCQYSQVSRYNAYSGHYERYGYDDRSRTWYSCDSDERFDHGMYYSGLLYY